MCYEKKNVCVFITAVPNTKLFAWGHHTLVNAGERVCVCVYYCRT
jgi:hypothetical protein